MDEYISFATSPTHLPTLLAISLLLGLGKGGVPGLATVATSATVLTAPAHIVGGLGYAVALMVPILTMIDVYAAWLHGEALDWKTVWLLLPSSVAGMVLGGLVDSYLTDQGARLLVGIILLGILALRTWKDVAIYLFPSYAIRHQLSGDTKEYKTIEAKGSDDEGDHGEEAIWLIQSSTDAEDHQHHVDVEGGESAKQKHNTVKNTTRRKTQPSTTPTTKILWACTVGLIGGAATMLTNSMGPILNVYLLSIAELSPQSYIGTRAMFFCFLNIGKLPIRFMGGTLGVEMLPLAAGLGAVSVVGVFCAKPIMLGMDQKTFVRLELGVVGFGFAFVSSHGRHAETG